MKTILRTPWPLFGIGLGLAVAGIVVVRTRPEWGYGAIGIALAVATFGGLLLIAISPSLQNAVSDREARRNLKTGVLWVGTWLLLKWGFAALSAPIWSSVEPWIGGVGSPSRILAAFGLFLFQLVLPLVLAAPLLVYVRRAAAWLGEE